MSIEVEFLRDNRLMFVRLGKVLDLAEYRQVIAKMHRTYFDSSPVNIHAILDLTEAEGLPRNVISNALGIAKMQHAKTGTVVFVVGKGPIASLVEVLMRITRDPDQHMVRSFDEAYAIIEDMLEKESLAMRRDSEFLE